MASPRTRRIRKLRAIRAAEARKAAAVEPAAKPVPVPKPLVVEAPIVVEAPAEEAIEIPTIAEAPVEAPEADYSAMTKAELCAALDDRGIEYSRKASKPALLELAEG